MIEPIEAAEPIENADSAEPIDPIDRIEPTDPIERIEPLQPMHRNESWDLIDQRDRDDRDIAAILALVRHQPPVDRFADALGPR